MQTPSISTPESATIPIDWANWLRRWDAQQTGYLPDRDERFGVMFDALDVLLPPAFVALDLACGPGSLSQRLLARFPQARCVALDKDPVLLAMGQGALGDLGGRLRWADLDLASDDWAAQLGETKVDAALSTTALHWLSPSQLAQVYRRLGELIRPGGVFLNGDNMRFPPHLPHFRKVSDEVKATRRANAFAQQGAEDWQSWWDAIAREPATAHLLAERERRFTGRARDWTNAGFDFHVGALRDSGFTEVDVIWQSLDNRVLMAVRGDVDEGDRNE